jgi:exosortase/archaeosortase family protein
MDSLRAALGLLLSGYGTLAGALSLALGLILLLRGLPHIPPAEGPLASMRTRLVAALGAIAVAGVVGANLARGSGISLPEWGIAAYGAALVFAAPHLGRRIGRTDVGTLVGWSFPVLLAPLAMFSLNAFVSSPSTGAAAAPLVHVLFVLPTAFGLRLFGTPVELVGNNLLLQVDGGVLSLGVGLVCAGLYPIVLFSGLVALHAWRTGMPPRRLAAVLGLGVAGLWVANIIRLVLLAKVGQRWGAGWLQEAHANLGWILFALYMVLFWTLMVRREEAQVAAKP